MKLALEPRVVKVDFDSHVLDGFIADFDTSLLEPGFSSRVPVPAGLRVCQDSRAAVESLYPLCFGNYLWGARIRFDLH